MPASTAAIFLTLAAVSFGASAAVRTETRGGLIPTGAMDSPPSLDVTIVPSASMSLSRASSALSLGYDMRLLRRFFVDVAERFILMHNARVGYSDQFGRGWMLTLDVSARHGEVDYANANLNLPTPGSTTVVNQGTTPDAVSVPIFSLAMAAGLRGTLGRNHSISFGVGAGHQAPLSRSVEDGMGGTIRGRDLFQEQTDGSLTLGYGYVLTTRVRLTTSVGLGFVTFPADDASMGVGQNYVNGSGTGGAVFQIGRSNVLSGSVGVLLSEGTGGLLPSPVGNISWQTTWASNVSYQLTTTLNTGVSGTPNGLTGNFEPRGSARLLVAATLGKEWTLGLSGFFGSPIPIGRSGAAAPAADAMGSETSLGGDFRVGYRINETFSVDSGVSAQISAGRLDAAMINFRSPSFTGYIGISAAVGLVP